MTARTTRIDAPKRGALLSLRVAETRVLRFDASLIPNFDNDRAGEAMLGTRGVFAVSAVLVIVSLAFVPAPAAAERPYKWKLVCRGASTFTALAEWFWTENGSAASSTESMSCADGATVDGNGTRPPTANDFTVTITVDDPGSGVPGFPTTFTTTFDFTHHFGDRFIAVLTDHEEAIFVVNSWPD